ncbi:hypothetical protein FJQ87_17555 [Shewanella sp. SNU WT4]|uniref:hypothetical protein n=1 Tax=Shewanella sp. SNU WT4 TaxID=2590015 RepID=UPI001126A89B|nr:hypothetical protein [Shewanella sp. SNU WT4]QDF68241.1 hypothetical protein FJQ87_17555 [Shewanella sp. SNU WT4]
MPRYFQWLLVLLIILIIKTSLLGMAMLSMGLALLGLMLTSVYQRWSQHLDKQRLELKFRQVFLATLLLHTSLYLGLLVKLVLIDSWQDIATFILSHLLLHHSLSAAIAGIITLLAVSIYVQAQPITGLTVNADKPLSAKDNKQPLGID